MNRRNFLKKLGIVCGATIACPTELLKGEPGPKPGFYDVKFEPGWRGHLWMRGREGSYIEGEGIPYGIPYWVGSQGQDPFIMLKVLL